MSLIYYSILTSVRLGRSDVEIVEQITSQCEDDPIRMVAIITNELLKLIRKDMATSGEY